MCKDKNNDEETVEETVFEVDISKKETGENIIEETNLLTQPGLYKVDDINSNIIWECFKKNKSFFEVSIGEKSFIRLYLIEYIQANFGQAIIFCSLLSNHIQDEEITDINGKEVYNFEPNNKLYLSVVISVGEKNDFCSSGMIVKRETESTEEESE